MRRHATRLLATSLNTRLASVNVQLGPMPRRNRSSLIEEISAREGMKIGAFEIQGGAEVNDGRLA